MNEIDFLLRLVVSMAIGGLIGLEREQHRDHEMVIAGVRTYPLIAIAGMLFAFLDVNLGIPSAIPIGLGVFAAVALAYLYIRHSLKLSGFTSPIAILVTYVIGVLVGHGLFIEGVTIGVATTFILLAKGRLHSFALAVTEAEMMGALQFILVAFILYPVTVAASPIIIRGYNVSELVDLSTVVLTVVLVSLISFISFLAIRYFGSTKGLAFTGALGGLVNSEAATASIANYVCRDRKLAPHALSGIVLANTGMLARNLVISAISDTSFRVMAVLLVPLASMGMLSFVYFSWANRRRTTGKPHELEMESPFGMWPAVKLGLLIGFTSVIVYTLAKNPVGGGDYAIYLTALIGFASSGAVCFSVSTLAFTGQVDPLVAGEVAMLACLFSTVNKIIIMRSDSKELANYGWKVFAALLAAGMFSFLAVDVYLRTVWGWG